MEFGAGGGHVGVPEVAADVVDDLTSGFDGMASCAGVEGVDGEDGFGALFEDGFDDGEDAGLLFVGSERRGVGAGGFAADVEYVGALVEHGEGLGEGAFGGMLGRVEVAAVGEGVGCDVEDAHDEGSLAEGEDAGAEMPVEARSSDEGHGKISVGQLQAWADATGKVAASTSSLPVELLAVRLRTCRPGSASLWVF